MLFWNFLIMTSRAIVVQVCGLDFHNFWLKTNVSNVCKKSIESVEHVEVAECVL